jgi:hypothetical protein
MKPEVLHTMRRTLLNLALCAALLAMLAGTALGHHGWTGYDEQRTLTLTGVIRESSWENPHGLIKLQTGDGKGKTWLVYLPPRSSATPIRPSPMNCARKKSPPAGRPPNFADQMSPLRICSAR